MPKHCTNEFVCNSTELGAWAHKNGLFQSMNVYLPMIWSVTLWIGKTSHFVPHGDTGCASEMERYVNFSPPFAPIPLFRLRGAFYCNPALLQLGFWRTSDTLLLSGRVLSPSHLAIS